MHRIDTSNAVANLFGPGKSGFGPGDPATNSPATFVDKDFFNAIQEELANLVEGAGLTLDKANRAQVLAAMQALFKPSVAGEVRIFARSTPPPGRWLRANGAALLVSSYSDLTTNIYCGDANNASAQWGYRCSSNSNPSTTRATNGAYIVLPDYRGRFARAWADDGAVDAARNFWAYQTDAMQNIWGQFAEVTGGTAYADGAFGGAGVGRNQISSGVVAGAGGINFDASRVVRTAAETRPTNIAGLACIAY